MQTFLNRFSRWKHSLGFGIHSPFAYRFITEVLCQHLPYYGYADISRDSRIRLLYRLVAAIQPRAVAILADQPALLAGAVKRADSRIPVLPVAAPSDCTHTLIVADDCDVSPDTYIPSLVAGAHALVLNATASTHGAIASALPHGMIFFNRHGTIVVASYRHLPRQDFAVKF